jgi:hypothetical protein
MDRTQAIPTSSLLPLRAQCVWELATRWTTCPRTGWAHPVWRAAPGPAPVAVAERYCAPASSPPGGGGGGGGGGGSGSMSGEGSGGPRAEEQR